MLHDFRTDLKYSEEASTEPFWDKVYRKAFPGLVNHMATPGDFATQREGIDRLILLNNGRVLRIDEKKRREVYQDILLEFVSSTANGTPGWMEKNLVIDYIAYAFMPTQKVYFLDWLTLRRAWVANKDAWISTYRNVSARNKTYDTKSVAVPIHVLQRAMNFSAVIQLSASEMVAA